MKNGRQDRIAETLTPIPYFFICMYLFISGYSIWYFRN